MGGLVPKMAQSIGFWAYFYTVFTEIGPLGFTEFGSASKRTDTSK